MHTLSIDQLQSFITIAETGSYTKAAEQLYRTQPALSIQMKRLEEQLGAELFTRNGRESTLTEAGRVLMSYARKILELNDEAIGKLSVVETTGSVRVGMLEEVTLGPMVGLLTRFGRLCSQIRIELEVSTSWELARKIQRNELCLAVANDAYSDMPSTPLWSEKYHWAVGGDFDPEEHDVLPLIVDPVDSPCAGLAESLEALNAWGRRWEIVFSSVSLNATTAAVRAGLGVGMVSESALTGDMRILDGEDGMPPIPEAHIALYRGTEATSTAVDSLAEFLVGHLRDSNPHSAQPAGR